MTWITNATDGRDALPDVNVCTAGVSALARATLCLPLSPTTGASRCVG